MLCVLSVLLLLGVHDVIATGLGDNLGSVVNRSMLGGGPSFGENFMERTYSSYATLPMNETDLKVQGWVKTGNSSCNPDLGWEWLQGGETVTLDKPIVLYTTEAGQVSGVGVLMAGDPPDPQKKWAQQKSNGWQMDVAFRHGDILCSGQVSEAAIGDTLIVNPSGPKHGGEKKVISLVEEESNSAGWHRGSCFDGMGWHRYLDTDFHNTSMSWKAENLFPVAAMYSEGKITAMNFATWTLQQGITGSHQWDTLPTPSWALCTGMCDSSCKTFAGTHFWSTMHIFFRNHRGIKCEPGLKCELGQSGTGGGTLCCKP